MEKSGWQFDDFNQKSPDQVIKAHYQEATFLLLVINGRISKAEVACDAKKYVDDKNYRNVFAAADVSIWRTLFPEASKAGEDIALFKEFLGSPNLEASKTIDGKTIGYALVGSKIFLTVN